MEKVLTQAIDFHNVGEYIQSFCVGKIVRITDDGRALVDYPTNQTGPVEARSIINVSAAHCNRIEENNPVLLVFENGHPLLPIIVGIVRERVRAPILQEIMFATEPQYDADVDGKRLVFDAKEEIVLRCGKGSITLRKDGKIVLKGADIVSRASRTNKIQGASVKIN